MSSVQDAAACGKTEFRERLQDKVTGALIGLARATDGNEFLISESANAVVIESLCALRSGDDFKDAELEVLLKRIEEEKRKMVPNCFDCAAPCGRTSAYDMRKLRNANEEVRALKFRLLQIICDTAASICRVSVPRCPDDTVNLFFYKALAVIGMDDFGAEALRPILQEADEVNLKCRFLPET